MQNFAKLTKDGTKRMKKLYNLEQQSYLDKSDALPSIHRNKQSNEELGKNATLTGNVIGNPFKGISHPAAIVNGKSDTKLDEFHNKNGATFFDSSKEVDVADEACVTETNLGDNIKHKKRKKHKKENSLNCHEDQADLNTSELISIKRKKKHKKNHSKSIDEVDDSSLCESAINLDKNIMHSEENMNDDNTQIKNLDKVISTKKKKKHHKKENVLEANEIQVTTTNIETINTDKKKKKHKKDESDNLIGVEVFIDEINKCHEQVHNDSVSSDIVKKNKKLKKMFEKEQGKLDSHNLITEEVCYDLDTSELIPVKHKKRKHNLDASDRDTVLYEANNIDNEACKVTKSSSKKKKKHHKKDKIELEDLNTFDKKRKKHKRKDKNHNLDADFCQMNSCVEQMHNVSMSEDNKANLSMLFTKEAVENDSHHRKTNEIRANHDNFELSHTKHKKDKENLDNASDKITLGYEKHKEKKLYNDLQTSNINDIHACQIISRKKKKKRNKKDKEIELKTNKITTSNEEKLEDNPSDLNILINEEPEISCHPVSDKIYADVKTSEVENFKPKKKHKKRKLERSTTEPETVCFETEVTPVKNLDYKMHETSNKDNELKINDFNNDGIASEIISSKNKKKHHKNNKNELIDNNVCDNERIEKKDKNFSLINANSTNEAENMDVLASTVKDKTKKKISPSKSKCSLENNDNHHQNTSEIRANYDNFELSHTKHKKVKENLDDSSDKITLNYEKHKEKKLYNDLQTSNINDIDAGEIISRKKKKKRNKKDKEIELKTNKIATSNEEKLGDNPSDLNILIDEEHEISCHPVSDKIYADVKTSELDNFKPKKKHKKRKLERNTTEPEAVYFESEVTPVKNLGYKMHETNNIDNELKINYFNNDDNPSEIISSKKKKKHHKNNNNNELKDNNVCDNERIEKKDKNFSLINCNSTNEEENMDELASTVKDKAKKKTSPSKSKYSLENNDNYTHDKINKKASDAVISKNIKRKNHDVYSITENDEQSDSLLHLEDLDKSESKKHKQTNAELQFENEKNTNGSYQSLIHKSIDHKSNEVEELFPAEDNIKPTDKNAHTSCKVISKTTENHNFQPILSLDLTPDPVDFKVPILHEKETVTRLTENEKNSYLVKGVIIKTGNYTFEEDKIIKQNFENFTQKYGFSDPLELLGVGRYKRDRDILNFIRAKHFYVRLGKGLNNRTLNSIYKRARLILHPVKTEPKTRPTKTEIFKLQKLQSTYNNKWNHIAESLGKEPDNCCQIFRWHEKKISKGHWTKEEENQLVEAIKKVSGSSEISCDRIQNINWNVVATSVPTRNFSQCRMYWAEHFGWKSDSEKKKWDHYSYIKLINILVKDWFVEDSSKINWHKVHESFVDVAPTHIYLRKKWYYLRKKVPNYKTKSHRDILRTLCKLYNIECDSQRHFF